MRKGKRSDIYICSIFVLPSAGDRHFGVIATVDISEDNTMSTRRAPTHRDDESDDIPPPYTLVPTDGVSLQFGPARPFQPPPQQPRLPQLRQPSPELSDFARDFYATGRAPSRSLEDVRQPPPRPQTQNSAPDDGRPTRYPVPGHPLLNNGKTLVYPQGYECSKCLSSLRIFPRTR